MPDVSFNPRARGGRDCRTYNLFIIKQKNAFLREPVVFCDVIPILVKEHIPKTLIDQFTTCIANVPAKTCVLGVRTGSNEQGALLIEWFLGPYMLNPVPPV